MDHNKHATSNTVNYTPSTKELQVLQKYIGYLTDVITDPVALAADLSVAELISDVTCQKTNNDNSSQETRNYRILNQYIVAVAINPTNLMKIISVLQGHPSSTCQCYC